MPFHNPFDALRHLRDQLPEQEKPSEATPATPREPPPAPAIPRAVVRLERAGRRGKEVTMIEQLRLSPAELDEWLKAVKSSLGTGGTVEGDRLVIQGDQRKRLPALLAARGVKKVTIG